MKDPGGILAKLAEERGGKSLSIAIPGIADEKPETWPTVAPGRHGVMEVEKPRKYRNKPTDYDGIRFDSKAEADYAAELDMRKRAGEVRFWARQVKFRLGVPENVYVVDFLIVGTSGRVWCVDVKGRETAKFKRDMLLWESYGECDLMIVKRKEVDQVIRGGLDPAWNGMDPIRSKAESGR